MNRDDIIIRGMRNGILVSFDDSLDIDTFYSRLAEQLEDPEVQPLFGAGQVILDLGTRDIANVEMTEVAAIFDRYGLSLQRIIARPETGPPAVLERDRYHGKKKAVWTKPRPLPSEPWPGTGEEAAVAADKTLPAAEVIENRPQAKEEVNSARSLGNEDGNTLLIQRNLRSGQSVEYNGNVVIMGDVNPGAEVIAGGSIVVLGSFRGIAHAGASGDESSTITAFRLRPIQLRIAGHITRPPDGDSAGPEIPEIARIREGVVVIEKY